MMKTAKAVNPNHIFIVTNNYKDYRLLMWIEATSPEKVKIITK
jgi:hypothetical protein